MQVNDDLQLTAPGPPQVTGFGAQVVGVPGIRRYWYWVVAHYPIGPSLTGPLLVSNAPDVLNVLNYVRLVWEPAIGAISYDVLRTDTARFPSGPGNHSIAVQITGTTTPDQGGTPGLYDPSGLPYGAPASRRVHLNNRDYAQPMLELEAVRVASITFPDGSTATTAGGGGGESQTPWLSDIDGASHQLNNASAVGIGDNVAAAPFANASLFVQAKAGSNNAVQIQQLAAANYASIVLLNNFGSQFILGMGGSGVAAPRGNTCFISSNNDIIVQASGNEVMRFKGNAGGNANGPGMVGIKQPAPTYNLDVIGTLRISGAPPPSAGSQINFPTNLPTSATGLSPGDVWNNGGVLNIV